VGEEEKYILGKNISEGNQSFAVRTVRSPEVATTMEREERERKRKRKKGSMNCYIPEGRH
jgi:hypothetical protein